MLERRTGDSRNDVGLSPGGIVRHVDLEIGSFAGDISLYLAFAAAAAADAVVSLFRVGSSGGAATSAELLVLLLLVLVLVLVVAVNNRSSIFFGFGFFFCSALLSLCLRRCGIWSQKEEWRNGGVLVGIGGKGRTVNLWCGERVCVFVTPCQNWERKRERERLRRSWLVTLDLGVVLCCIVFCVSLVCHYSNFKLLFLFFFF